MFENFNLTSKHALEILLKEIANYAKDAKFSAQTKTFYSLCFKEILTNRRTSYTNLLNIIVILILSLISYLSFIFNEEPYRSQSLVMAFFLLLHFFLNTTLVIYTWNAKNNEIFNKLLMTVNQYKTKKIDFSSIDLFLPSSPSLSYISTYRDKKFITLPQILLVKGDIIILQEGSTSPALCHKINDKDFTLCYGEIYKKALKDNDENLSELSHSNHFLFCHDIPHHQYFIIQETPSVHHYIKEILSPTSSYRPPMPYMERNKNLTLSIFTWIIFPTFLVASSAIVFAKLLASGNSQKFRVWNLVLEPILIVVPSLFVSLDWFWLLANAVGNAYLNVFTCQAKTRRSNVEVEAFENDSELVGGDEDLQSSSDDSDTSNSDHTRLMEQGQKFGLDDSTIASSKKTTPNLFNYSSISKYSFTRTHNFGIRSPFRKWLFWKSDKNILWKTPLSSAPLPQSTPIPAVFGGEDLKRIHPDEQLHGTKDAAGGDGEENNNSSSPQSLWRAFFDALSGKCPSLPFSRNPLATLSCVSNVCPLDKEGMLSWPDPYPEKTLVIYSSTPPPSVNPDYYCPQNDVTNVVSKLINPQIENEEIPDAKTALRNETGDEKFIEWDNDESLRRHRSLIDIYHETGPLSEVLVTDPNIGTRKSGLSVPSNNKFATFSGFKVGPRFRKRNRSPGAYLKEILSIDHVSPTANLRKMSLRKDNNKIKKHDDSFYEKGYFTWRCPRVVPASPGPNDAPPHFGKRKKSPECPDNRNQQNAKEMERGDRRRNRTFSGLDNFNQSALNVKILALSHEPNHPENISFEDCYWSDYLPNLKPLAFAIMATTCNLTYSKEIKDFYDYLSSYYGVNDASSPNHPLFQPPRCLLRLADLTNNRSSTQTKPSLATTHHNPPPLSRPGFKSSHLDDKFFFGVYEKRHSVANDYYSNAMPVSPHMENSYLGRPARAFFSVLIKDEAANDLKAEEGACRYQLFSCGSPDFLGDFCYDAWDGLDIQPINHREYSDVDLITLENIRTQHANPHQPPSDSLETKLSDFYKREVVLSGCSDCVAFAYKPLLPHEAKYLKTIITAKMRSRKRELKMAVLTLNKNSRVGLEAKFAEHPRKKKMGIKLHPENHVKFINGVGLGAGGWMERDFGSLCVRVPDRSSDMMFDQYLKTRRNYHDTFSDHHRRASYLSNSCSSSPGTNVIQAHTPTALAVDGKEKSESFFSLEAVRKSADEEVPCGSRGNSLSALPSEIEGQPIISFYQNIHADTTVNVNGERLTNSGHPTSITGSSILPEFLNLWTGSEKGEQIVGSTEPRKSDSCPTRLGSIKSTSNSEAFNFCQYQDRSPSPMSDIFPPLVATAEPKTVINFNISASRVMSLLSHQILLGCVSALYPPKIEYFQIIDTLDSAFIRFVHFSRDNETRSKIFAEKIGLDIGWNCSISLKNKDLEYRKNGGIDSGSRSGMDGEGAEKSKDFGKFIEIQKKPENPFTTSILPKGIKEIKQHLSTIDNVPLLVPLFTDCYCRFKPANQNESLNKTTMVLDDSVLSMIGIMQEYREVVVTLGSCFNLQNLKRFAVSDLAMSVRPLLPHLCLNSASYPSENGGLHHNNKIMAGKNKDTTLLSYYGLAGELISLTCSYNFQPDDNLCITRVIKKARQISANIISSCIFMVYFNLYLSLSHMISFLVFLPPMFNAYNVVWLLTIVCPTLTVSLLANPAKLKVMDMATAKNALVTKEKIAFNVFIFLLKFIPFLGLLLVTYGFILSSLCDKQMAEMPPANRNGRNCTLLTFPYFTGYKKIFFFSVLWRFPGLPG
ncbi:uncharacterized protein LOC135930011 isoform X2 [Gordionus sp. m RMFG-2023]|uniref:uncharacterized protein LOC135930011 isoform X2 n=1 Tax=Gordionus sp. m RMFG-2023 TaxID=3053472 RepID=UPI0031FBCAED